MPSRRAASGRDRLVKAATELFAHQGFRATSVDDIAELAGTSRSLVFFHFGTKDGLLSAVVEKTVAEYTAPFFHDDETRSGIAALRDVIDARSKAGRARHELARLVYQLMGDAIGVEPQLAPRLAALNREVRSHFARLVRRAQAAGEMRADVDADDIALVLVSAFQGNTLQALLDPAVDQDRGDMTMFAIVEALSPPSP
jgi:AcrR family transcriptional regulator